MSLLSGELSTVKADESTRLLETLVVVLLLQIGKTLDDSMSLEFGVLVFCVTESGSVCTSELVISLVGELCW